MGGGGASHHPLSHTFKEISKHRASDLCVHSITSASIKALIDLCHCQSLQYVQSPKLHDTLTDVQIKYHAHLQKGVQKGKCVTWYDCHQVGVPRRVHAFTQR